ncbi:MAG: hypothetical protein GKR94_23755 [Gammaproteobacteria bacterium]|nr:hypothetical protein [Gammaproteobacteria bacterium]
MLHNRTWARQPAALVQIPAAGWHARAWLLVIGGCGIVMIIAGGVLTVPLGLLLLAGLGRVFGLRRDAVNSAGMSLGEALSGV